MTDPTPSRSEVRRLPERGVYDTEAIYSILDEALICHLGFATDSGPVVIPTIHARAGGTLYLHGSHASRMMRSIPENEVCVTATIVDGIVAARSAFHHSMNYRSVVVFGTPRVVDDPEERMIAFEAVTEHVLPGRWAEARWPNEKEDKGTKLLALSIDEALPTIAWNDADRFLGRQVYLIGRVQGTGTSDGGHVFLNLVYCLACFKIRG